MYGQPRNTNLDLICDNRSGAKLELVFPTNNEEVRIKSILSRYMPEFDVVILDGGSGDKTCDLVCQYGGTVYKRIGDMIGENHFVYYVNNLTKSGRCFYMSCDEFVEVSDLLNASKSLSEGGYHIFGRRIDWFYGMKARKPTCLSPKGFRRGEAIYEATNLHDSLRYVSHSSKKLIIDVQHLHVYSMKDDYGKFGYYIYHEVLQLRKTRNPIKSFFIRFLKLLRNLQLGLVRFPQNLWLILFLVAQFFASFFLFFMCLIEQLKLNSRDEQLRKYKNKYQKAK
jgi:hypothetical protein